MFDSHDVAMKVTLSREWRIAKSHPNDILYFHEERRNNKRLLLVYRHQQEINVCTDMGCMRVPLSMSVVMESQV